LTVLNQADHAFLLCGGQILDEGNVRKIRQYFEGKCHACHHQNDPEDEMKENLQ
jgi:Fe-S cluster assembly ATP-binding protein